MEKDFWSNGILVSAISGKYSLTYFKQHEKMTLQWDLYSQFYFVFAVVVVVCFVVWIFVCLFFNYVFLCQPGT